MRPLGDAQRDVLAAMPLLPAAEVPLGEALGLATAAAVRAAHDVPPFTNSAMDGYAVLAADVAGAPVELEVLEDVPAGSVATRPIGPGTAIKIMTGAPLPEGADAVVKVEDTEPGEGRVRILAAHPAGTAVRPAGGDVAAGQAVLGAGVRLGAAHLGMLASFGVARPLVRRRPVVAVMSTGDEVLAVDEPLPPGKIHDSNRPMLVALLGELGADVVDMGIVRDEPGTLRAALEGAAGKADAVVSSGGVSMGEYDLVKAVLRELGHVEFWQVAMQPAKPFAFGQVAGTPLFGLPGNPVSSVVAFEQFVRPGLLTMMGATAVFRPQVDGVMDEAVSTAEEKTVFVRVQVEWRDGAWHARPSGGQSSNVLSALAAAGAYAVVPVGTGEVPAGGAVALEMFRWPEARSAVEVLG